MRAVTASVARRGFAAAAPKKAGGKKDKGGPAQAVGGIGDFLLDEMFLDLKLGDIKAADLPPWVQEEYDNMTVAVKEKNKPTPPAGQEDRKYFKAERKKKIKADNERRELGME